MSKVQVFKALIAVLILNVMVFAFVTGCDDNDGGGGMNCCQFLETCEGNIGQQNCADQEGEFVQNAQCFEDVGLCIAVATPTPTPTPSATPTPTPAATPTPTPTATPTPTPTPTVSPTPTPTPTASCETVPDRMDDEFFELNAVTYIGEVVIDEEPVEVVKVLTADLTPFVPECMIVVNTEIMGIPATVPLTGVISEDGTMCTFDGTDTVIMTGIGNLNAMIISGSATLSAGGQELSLSVIMADVEEIGVQSIGPVGPCTCQSVEPIAPEARTEDALRIHGEKMEELGIGTGN